MIFIILFIIFTISYGFLSKTGILNSGYRSYQVNYYNFEKQRSTSSPQKHYLSKIYSKQFAYEELNKNDTNNGNFNFLNKPHFEYFLYDEDNPVYIIIANINKESNDLLKDIKKNRINYIFADKYNFTQDDLIESCNYFKITDKKLILTKPLIFKGINEYIGSTFEMYEIISKY